jgi:DNA-binding XRE family transcriptional regulator
MNPVKKYRQNAHLTQQELADKIGVTRQTIVDTEQGLFPLIPPTIKATLPANLNLAEDYRDWVRQERQRNTDRFAPELTHVHSFQDYVNEVGGSTRGFCRVLVIQTSIVRDYISKRERWGMIEFALAEAEVPGGMIEWLRELPR